MKKLLMMPQESRYLFCGQAKASPFPALPINWDTSLEIPPQKDPDETSTRLQAQMDWSSNSYTKLVTENAKLKKQLSKQKEIKEQLLLSKEKLAKLTSHLQSISEEERSSIAREIHDELGQSLTALKLESSWLLGHIGDWPEHEPFIGKLQLISDIIDSTTKRVKSLSTRIRPRILDDLGIAAAIEWKVKNFQEHTGIKCDIQIEPGEIDLNKDASTAMFRVFQEAFTNIIRHSNATAAKVKLMRKSNRAILKIQDDGIGITAEQIHARESLGILGMIERIRSLDGEVKIKGIQNRGTTIYISLPLKKEARVID
jgi:signal transduction histidine kinase